VRHLSLPGGPSSCYASQPILMTSRLPRAAPLWALLTGELQPSGLPELDQRSGAPRLSPAAEAFLPKLQSSFHAFPDGRLRLLEC
jgi:hypothetical protein